MGASLSQGWDYSADLHLGSPGLKLTLAQQAFHQLLHLPGLPIAFIYCVWVCGRSCVCQEACVGMWALVCVPGGMCGSQRALGGLALYFHHVGPGLAAGPSLHLSLSPTISLGTNCEQDFVSEFFLLASFLDFAIFF